MAITLCDGTSAAGISTDPQDSNAVYVSQGAARRSSKDIAQTTSHEVAHMLGFRVGAPLSHYTEAEHHDL